MKKKINPTLLELCLGILLYGAVFQIALLFFVGELSYSIGLWIGVVLAVAGAFHMWWALDRGLDLPEKDAVKSMGVVQNGVKGLSFDTARLGIRCQVQHLKAYACLDELKNENVDPRFKYVVRGCAPYVEWLGIRENPQGKGWAAGAGYGEKILSIMKEIAGEAGSAGDGADSPDNPVQPMSGYVKVFYKGRDGVNVRTAPCMGDNVDQVVYEGIYTVTGISLDKRWYRLKSGLFITADAEYVMFMERLPGKSSYLVRVDIPDLNIRKGPGTDFARTGLFTGAGTFTIVEEADGKGAGKWGLLKSYKRERNGWISLDFVTRL